MNIIKNIYKKIEFLKAKNVNEIALLHKKYGVRMGNNCRIYRGVSFGSEPYLILLGNDVTITSGNNFITHDGSLRVLRNMGLLPNSDRFGQIEIGNNVWIGLRCTIMPGVKIGDNVIIGTGSIVTKDIPSNSVAAGVPCKVLKDINLYYEGVKNMVDYTNNLNSKDKKDYLIKKYNLDIE
ncbi:acyltransferase [Priestia megaterium]|uniref:acyltransferase n=1 Tax=Priestia megaterium TaxID=1404 RepID=UPI003009194E